MIPALAFLLVVAILLLERRADRSAFAAERYAWTVERSALLNRIKPETAQPTPGEPVVMFQPPDLDDDEAQWALKELA